MSTALRQMQPITARGYQHLAAAILNDALADLQRPAQDRDPAMAFLRSDWAVDLAALAIDVAPTVWLERVEVVIATTVAGVKPAKPPMMNP